MSPDLPRAEAAAVRPLRLPSLRGEPAETAPRPVGSRPAAKPALSPQELESLRSAAHAEGLAIGLREGRERAQAEWAARLEQATRALEGAGQALLAARVEVAASVERELPRLLLVLARKVLRQELTVSQTAAQTVIRGIAERLGGCAHASVVKLHPASVEAFEAWRSAGHEESNATSLLRVQPDPALGPGEWLLETGDGFLDGRVESQLEEAWRLLEGLAS